MRTDLDSSKKLLRSVNLRLAVKGLPPKLRAALKKEQRSAEKLVSAHETMNELRSQRKK